MVIIAETTLHTANYLENLHTPRENFLKQDGKITTEKLHRYGLSHDLLQILISLTVNETYQDRMWFSVMDLWHVRSK